MYARLPQPVRQDAAHQCDQGRRETTPDTNRHPGRTLGNVPTSGRLVYSSEWLELLSLGKTSARYRVGVPPSTYGQPKYRVIAQRLREWIEGGQLPTGALVPTEKALMAEFRASRGTVRQAIALLREEGYLQTERARGTYVRHPRAASAGRECFQAVPADEELAALLGLTPGESIVCRQTVVGAGEGDLVVIRRYSKS